MRFRRLSRLAVLATAGFLVVVPAASHAEFWKVKAQWKMPGKSFSPGGLAYSGGYVYASDVDNDRILKFTSSGRFAGQWGHKGHGAGQFNEPLGVATDAASNVYVADFGNHRIQKFSPSGTFLAEMGLNIPVDSSGPPVLLTTAVAEPVGVAVDGAGYVYVSGQNESAPVGDTVGIVKLSPTLFYINPSFTVSFGGSSSTGYDTSDGIAVDSAGKVYASHAAGSEDSVVQVFTPDGALVASWGNQGKGRERLANNHDIAVDNKGHAYVTQLEDAEVKKFTLDGQFLAAMHLRGDAISGAAAVGIAVSPSGKSVYVGELNNGRIEVLRPISPCEHARDGLKGARRTLRRAPRYFKAAVWAARKRVRQAERKVRRICGGGGSSAAVVIPSTARKAIFRAVCKSSSRCRAKVNIAAGKKTLARGRYAVPPHKSRKVRIALTKAGRRTMARRRHAAAKLTIVDTRTHKRETLPVILRRRG